MSNGAIDGWTADGFEGVRAAFEKNFAEGLEVGAAFAAYHRGRLVADLWGGIADVKTQRPWERDTMIVVFSTTKGMTAICANKLAQEGLLDVDAPVAQYWPEFAPAGKDEHPGPLPVVAPCRPCLGRRAAHTRAGAAVGAADPRARTSEALLGTRDGARLSRDHVRLPGG